jgi:hypothetical protein
MFSKKDSRIVVFSQIILLGIIEGIIILPPPPEA